MLYRSTCTQKETLQRRKIHAKVSFLPRNHYVKKTEYEGWFENWVPQLDMYVWVLQTM